MPSKGTFLAGFATGYVLGSRAGRQRYEQIRRAARSVAASPAVQRTTASLQHQAGDALTSVRDRATAAVGEKLQERRPAWVGSGATTTPTAGDASWAAGSNGHVGA